MYSWLDFGYECFKSKLVCGGSELQVTGQQPAILNITNTSYCHVEDTFCDALTLLTLDSSKNRCTHTVSFGCEVCLSHAQGEVLASGCTQKQFPLPNCGTPSCYATTGCTWDSWAYGDPTCPIQNLTCDGVEVQLDANETCRPVIWDCDGTVVWINDRTDWPWYQPELCKVLAMECQDSNTGTCNFRPLTCQPTNCLAFTSNRRCEDYCARSINASRCICPVDLATPRCLTIKPLNCSFEHLGPEPDCEEDPGYDLSFDLSCYNYSYANNDQIDFEWRLSCW